LASQLPPGLPLLPSGPFGADVESWFANPINYRLLFEHFKSNNFSKVIVVSGDVHYGFSALFSLSNKEFWLGLSGGHEINGIQITSSGLKNSGKPLGLFANTPYSGAVYFLIFSDNRVAVAGDKAQAEQLILATRIRAASENSPAPVKLEPRYAVSAQKCFEFAVTGIMPNQFEYRELQQKDYPDLILTLKIKSLSPRTADFIEDHNFVSVQALQNQVSYRFNDSGQTYEHRL